MGNINIGKEIQSILETYGDDVKEIASKDSKIVADQCVTKLKSASPKRTGKYSEGWASKKSGSGAVVYNRNKPQLTHLIENGHTIKNQYGIYGRTMAEEHIAPVEEWGANEYERMIRNDL